MTEFKAKVNKVDLTNLRDALFAKAKAFQKPHRVKRVSGNSARTLLF